MRRINKKNIDDNHQIPANITTTLLTLQKINNKWLYYSSCNELRKLICFDHEGMVMYTINYHNNRLHGILYLYSANKLVARFKYHHGILHGISVIYSTSEVSILQYTNGVLNTNRHQLTN